MGLIFGRAWQTHLPPSPEGRLLASADYCPESGDIAHFILDPKSREIIIACFDSCFNEPEELCYFLKQENGLMAPVTKAESRKALDRLNANAKIEWSYPHTPRASPNRNDTGPWDPASPPILATCSTTTSGAPSPAGSSTRISSHRISVGMPGPDAYHPPERRPHPGWVRLPGMRQCYYLRTENAISPVSDTDFYGAEPLRISQEQLDAQEKRDAPEKRGKTGTTAN